jgi:hypothetical protein
MRIQATCVAILAGVIAMHPVISEDLFWHLASGRWILEHRSVPHTDVLTYSMTQNPWINLQWLGDVAFAALWKWGGADAVVLAKSAAFAGLGVLLVLSGAALGASPAAAGIAASLAILASAERTFERPEMASFLMLAATILLCIRARARSSFPFVVAGIHLLWGNVHALAFLGPLTLFLFAALAALPNRHPLAPSSMFAFAGGLSALSLLANPYGIATWTFPRTLLQRISGQEEIFSLILEFASPLRDPSDPALRFFWILLAACAVGILGAAVRGRSPLMALQPALFLLPFLILAMLARRNIPLFAIAAAPVLARLLTELSPRFRTGPSRSDRTRRLFSWAPPCAALLLAILLLRGGARPVTGVWRDPGLGVEPGFFPEECLTTLKRSGVHGPLFNDLDFGGYISWRDGPGRAWIDGRLEVIGAERLSSYIQAHSNPAVWERLQSSWKFEALLLEHSSSGNATFLLGLLEQGRWRLACLTPEAALLLPLGASGPVEDVRPREEDWTRILAQTQGPHPHAGRALEGIAAPLDRLLHRIQASPRNAPIRAACRLANACLTLGWLEEARTGYETTLRIAPRDSEARFNLGICQLRLGNVEEARKVWKDALPLVDRANRKRFHEALATIPE